MCSSDLQKGKHQTGDPSRHFPQAGNPVRGGLRPPKSSRLHQPCKKYYAAESDQEDLISIGTIGLIKAVSSYRLEKNIKFATYASRCIENEILMYFRSRRKSSSDVSLSELIETGSDGAALELMDVVAGEEDLLEELSARENARLLRDAVEQVLTEQEKQVVSMRYGLMGGPPQKQWEVAQSLGISRSYVSRPGYCKR